MGAIGIVYPPTPPRARLDADGYPAGSFGVEALMNDTATVSLAA